MELGPIPESTFADRPASVPPHQFSDSAERISRYFSEIHLDAISCVEPGFLSPFLGRGDFCNLSGLAGCGKTHLGADILIAAICPERGGSALGGAMQFDLSLLGDGRVAIIDAENTAARWASLLKRKADREELDLEDPIQRLVYFRPADGGLNDPRYWSERSVALAEALAARDVRFVVGDTLGMIWSPGDINASSWVQLGFAQFRSACQGLGISGVMLTHTRRPGGKNESSPSGPIGSSFQEGQTDTQIMVKRTTSDGQPCLELKLLKSRRGFWIQQGATVKLGFDGAWGYRAISDLDTKWPKQYLDESSSEIDPKPLAQEKVLRVLEADPEKHLSSTEIAQTCGITDRTVRNALSALADRDLVSRSGDGPSTRWRLAR